MSVIEGPVSGSSQGHQQMAEQLADVLPFTPRENEGLFLPEHQGDNVHRILPPLPSYDTVVDTTYRDYLGVKRNPGIGTVWHERWQMSDGTKYKVSIGHPERPKTDIAVGIQTPWGTQNQGYNEDDALTKLSLGIGYVLIGPEEGAEIPLGHSAHNAHAIYDLALDIGQFRNDWISLYGFSRGAEISLGTAAYAEQHGRNILYSHIIDPYGAAPIEFSREQLEEIRDVGLTEVGTAVQALGGLLLNPGRAWRYRQTVDLSLDGAKQFYRTGKAVLSGEAGELAQYFPEDGQATVVFFGKKDGRRRRLFEEAMAGRPGVKFTGPDKGHFINLDRRVAGKTTGHFCGLVTQLAAGVEPEDIDFELVHMQPSD